MFNTQNLKSLLECPLVGNVFSCPVKTTGGATMYINASSSHSTLFQGVVAKSYVTSYNSASIVLGNGTEAASATDYAMGGLLTDGFSAVVNTTSGVDANDKPYATFDILVTNTGSSNITIAEIGFAKGISASAAKGKTGGASYCMLLDRTVLAEPVTIAPGGYETLRYTITVTP